VNRLQLAELEAFKSKDWQINKFHNISGITTDSLIGRIKTHTVKRIKVICYEEIKPTDIVLTEWEHELPPRELTNINGKLYWRYEL